MSTKRCFYKTCRKLKNDLIGNCKYCKECFCINHRLPEEHTCSNMEKMKSQEKDKMGKKLVNEKCIHPKILKI